MNTVDIYLSVYIQQIIVAFTDMTLVHAIKKYVFSSPPAPPGRPQFGHVGEIVDGVDMRAEVAMLSRNILIYGEMENACYGNNWCQFFGHDTYGGHIKVCV
jgi:hypothetical protein